MTVYKKHMTPNGESGICSAKVRCPYGGESNHFYYDSSIKQEVLNPAHPIQQQIESVPSEELLEKASSLLAPGKEPSTEYKEYHAAVEQRTAEWEKQKDSIIKSYPVKHQNAVRLMTKMHEGAGMIASFDIFDPEEEDYTAKSSASDEEKLSFAKTYLNKFKAEQKLRAVISASHVN